MSKTIYLFRHSEPAADRTIPTSQIPLSYEGRKKIAGMVPRFERISVVYASPYLRAVQTAEAFGAEFHTDERLRERVIGRRGIVSGSRPADEVGDGGYSFRNAGRAVGCRCFSCGGDLCVSDGFFFL